MLKVEPAQFGDLLCLWRGNAAKDSSVEDDEEEIFTVGECDHSFRRDVEAALLAHFTNGRLFDRFSVVDDAAQHRPQVRGPIRVASQQDPSFLYRQHEGCNSRCSFRWVWHRSSDPTISAVGYAGRSARPKDRAMALRARDTSGVFEVGRAHHHPGCLGRLAVERSPARVVDDDGETLVHWSPAGTLGCSATSRSVPGREVLSPSERQLASLATRRWRYRGVPRRGTSLTFVREGRWASVAPTWFADGRFIHWYVNFQQPLVRTSAGYDTLDLIADIVVAPDWSWTWKDEPTFDAAIERGIFDRSILREVETEAARIDEEIAARTGPFDLRWQTWMTAPGWAPPDLLDDFAKGLETPPGSTITLSTDPVA